MYNCLSGVGGSVVLNSIMYNCLSGVDGSVVLNSIMYNWWSGVGGSVYSTCCAPRAGPSGPPGYIGYRGHAGQPAGLTSRPPRSTRYGHTPCSSKPARRNCSRPLHHYRHNYIGSLPNVKKYCLNGYLIDIALIFQCIIYEVTEIVT